MTGSNKKLLRFMKQLFVEATDDKDTAVSRIMQKKDFYVLLEKERFRADRLGSPFSLITLPLTRQEREAKTVKKLLCFFEHRIRIIDELGWFTNDTLGIFLFNTSRQGAAAFLERLQTEPDHPACIDRAEILIYPDTLRELKPDDGRNQERLDLDLTARLLLSGQERIEIQTRDISAHGAFLLTSTPLPQDTRVELEIMLPLAELGNFSGQDVALHAIGRVVRTEAQGVAVEFQATSGFDALATSSGRAPTVAG